jgi:hypothetical protein
MLTVLLMLLLVLRGGGGGGGGGGPRHTGGEEFDITNEVYRKASSILTLPTHPPTQAHAQHKHPPCPS